MKTWIALPAIVALALTATPGFAQQQDQRSRPIEEPAKPTDGPVTDEKAPGNASPKTGGDTTPSAVDPAQADKTGANAGEGASYNRSTEKGDSAMPKEDAEKKQ
jgi:hypothetical protein